MTLVETIRRIALLFQLEVQFASFSIFVCVARIFDRHPSGLWRRENCVHQSIRSNREWHHGDADRLIASSRLALLLRRARAKISSGMFFLFSLGHARFFFSQENFWSRRKLNFI